MYEPLMLEPDGDKVASKASIVSVTFPNVLEPEIEKRSPSTRPDTVMVG
jgi:hypothetical protein